MKAGTDSRKKTIAAGVLAAAALIAVSWFLYTQLGGGSSAPPPPQPVAKAPSEPGELAAPVASKAASNSNGNKSTAAAIPGVAAKRMESTSSSLDPTLDQTAMLRTESLVYGGNGRNIFSMVYEKPQELIKATLPNPRGQQIQVAEPPRPPAPVTCPPTCPPINLKFFGTLTRANGKKTAFLLQGEDVYQASEGDIVARKYKIVSITGNGIQVEDLTNNNTQTLPLQMN